jgi:ribonuclease BN (tRNA processing enzyme)
MSLKMLFLGSGGAFSEELGNSSAVLLENEKPILLIDCGLSTFHSYKETFQSLPEAIFITHCHFDHIASLEMLLYACHFSEQDKLTKIFCPADIIPALQRIVGSFPNYIAEGGINVWESVQLIPVLDSFWLNGHKFNVFQGRHHHPKASFGLSLPGHFLFTGDTRPIPENVIENASNNEIIFHDCSIESNASHSGIEDIKREYSQGYIDRMVFYHLDSLKSVNYLRQRGFKAVSPSDEFYL